MKSTAPEVEYLDDWVLTHKLRSRPGPKPVKGLGLPRRDRTANLSGSHTGRDCFPRPGLDADKVYVVFVVIWQRILDGSDEIDMPMCGDGREAFNVFPGRRIGVGVEAVIWEILDNEVQVRMGVNMHCHSRGPDKKLGRTCIPVPNAEDSLTED
jgi:hypothetical protein